MLLKSHFTVQVYGELSAKKALDCSCPLLPGISDNLLLKAQLSGARNALKTARKGLEDYFVTLPSHKVSFDFREGASTAPVILYHKCQLGRCA